MRAEAPMSGGSAKQKVLEVIEKDAIERLALLAKTERGLAELDAGQGVHDAEAKRRLLRVGAARALRFVTDFAYSSED